MLRPVRVLIVDDCPAMRLGLQVMLSSETAIEIAGQAESAFDALEQATAVRPDVVLLGSQLLRNNLSAMVHRLRERRPEARLVLLVGHEDGESDGPMPSGADGYITRTASQSEIIAAVLSVFGGRPVIGADCARAFLRQYEAKDRELVRLKLGLSIQEIELLRELSSGATNEQIAERLYLSEITVIRRIQHIVGKLGVANKTQAVAEVVRRAII